MANHNTRTIVRPVGHAHFMDDRGQERSVLLLGRDAADEALNLNVVKGTLVGVTSFPDGATYHRVGEGLERAY